MTTPHARQEIEGMRSVPDGGEPWQTLLEPPHPPEVARAAGALTTVTRNRRHAYVIAYTLFDAGLLALYPDIPSDLRDRLVLATGEALLDLFPKVYGYRVGTERASLDGALGLDAMSLADALLLFVRVEIIGEVQRRSAVETMTVVDEQPRVSRAEQTVVMLRGEDPGFVERLAADLCDRAKRPARSAYHPAAWEQAGRENAGPPESTKREWWRRHAREVIAAVRHQVPPTRQITTVADLEALGERAVVRCHMGIVYSRDPDVRGYWLRAGWGGRIQGDGVLLPAEVLDAGCGPHMVEVTP